MRRDNLELEENNIKLQYIRDLYAKENIILKEIREQLKLIKRPININPEEGRLLQLLIKMTNSKQIVEIGTLYGYSTIWMANILQNNPNAKIYTIEKDIESYEIANKYFEKLNLLNIIKSYNGIALEILDQQLTGIYDMVFIDANKGDYLKYLEWADLHIKSGGLIVLDNTLLSGAVYMNELPEKITQSCKEKMINLNNILTDENKYLSLMLPTAEGFTIVVKK